MPRELAKPTHAESKVGCPYQPWISCDGRSLKKDAKLKEKKSKAWKQRQGEQKQAQAKKQKK